MQGEINFCCEFNILQFKRRYRIWKTDKSSMKNTLILQILSPTIEKLPQ